MYTQVGSDKNGEAEGDLSVSMSDDGTSLIVGAALSLLQIQ